MSLSARLITFALAVASASTALSATPPSFAQNYGVASYFIDGQPTDDPFYGSGVDYPRAIAPMPDGGFVVAGQIAFPRLTVHTGYGGNSDAVLVRLAADGSIIWQTALHQTNGTVQNGVINPAPSYIAKMMTDAQGNVFVAGAKATAGS